MQQVDPPEGPRTNEIVALTGEELERLIKAFEGTPHYVPVALAARTGLRRDEVLALSVGDIDAAEGLLRVRRIIEDVPPGGDATRFAEPQFAQSREPIHLDDTALKLLREHLAQHLAETSLRGGSNMAPDRLLFARADGLPFTLSAFEKAFYDVAEQAGFPGLRFHHLRDTLAVRLVQAGEPISVVAERMRHPNSVTTSRRYAPFAEHG